jgi:Holliday junction resolvase-like predicted endonuclease
MKALPIGIQSFSKLRENNFLYIDKTKEIHRLITGGTAFFLSRPRRFGKSLLVSTLEEIFKGNKDLFEGLYIHDKIDWAQHPVIRLDFGRFSNYTPEALTNSLYDFLNTVASEHGFSLEKIELPDRFVELISRLHVSYGRRTVVLIDEYDKPITDNLSEPDIMEENKKILHRFYQILKAADEHLRFVFLTGVSKFAGVSIFSGLNNLRDITLSEDYSTICGYTQSELEYNFSEYVSNLSEKLAMPRPVLLDEIRFWYNGYSWDGKTSVYNPFSTLLLFADEQFDNYWFRTGTPTFLIELLKERNQLRPVLDAVVVDSSAFDSFNPTLIGEIPLLFQTGYLTIKQKEFVFGRPQYTLGIPNSEVNESLLKYLLSAYSNYPVEQERELKARMQQQLLAGDATGLEQSLREMLAHIPYPLHIGKEAYYHSLLLLWLKLLGFDITGEVTTNIGRIDAVWKFSGHIVIAEVKYQPQEKKISTLLDKAIKQIKEKKYAEKFDKGQKISLLAVAFAGKEIGCRIICN